jgi:hypothetical protein
VKGHGYRKTAEDMIAKYSTKYNGTIFGQLITNMQGVATARFQAIIPEFTTIRDLVEPILANYGVAGPQKAGYLAFAFALTRHANRNSGESLQNIASGMVSYYATAYGLNPTILNAIVNVVTGAVQYY